MGAWDRVKKEYLEEDFWQESGSLEFSCPKLELNLKKDEVFRGTFGIQADTKRPVEGQIYSHDNRMVCENAIFRGQETEVSFVFDAHGMEEGEVLKGELQVLTNLGEYILPYVVSIEYFRLQSSLGDIKNLFHFANLAKTSWEEARGLFFKPEFIEIFRDSDRVYKSAYKLLKRAENRNLAVEEFLLDIRKKQPVTYQTERETLVYHDLAGVTAEVLEIARNGWGYTQLEVSVEGAFLSLEKSVLTEDDFLGNRCKCVFYMDAEKLHAGSNYGSICLKSPHQEWRIPVTVVSTVHAQARRLRNHKKHLTLQLMQYYLAYRLQKIGADTWMEESEKIIEEWLSVDSKSVSCHLFKAQLLLTRERYNEAEWMLERVEPLLSHAKEEDQDSLYCYYLYLRSLLIGKESYTEQITREIRGIYRSDTTKWRIAWLLLYLEESYNRSAQRRFLFLEELFYQGVTSPVFYIEALRMMEDNPALFVRLREFETQVLLFAAKNEVLTRDLIGQIHYLAGRAKQMNGALYTILKACYEREADSETLKAICTLCIQAERTDEEAFLWYALAVRKELRIMRLYEYYMMALPEKEPEEIPRMVLLYFAYRSDLSYEQNARLYAYVSKHKEEEPEMYRVYRADMEQFIATQLTHGRINRSLAWLYQHEMTEKLLQEHAAAYVRLSFTCCIRVEGTDIHGVALQYGQKKEEEVYPVNGGCAYLPIYGEDYKLSLLGRNGMRYVAGLDYETEKMLRPGKEWKLSVELVEEDQNLDLFLCKNSREQSVDQKNVRRAGRLITLPQLEEGYRLELTEQLLHYYMEADKEYQVEILLRDIKPEGLSQGQRVSVIRYMVLREMYDKALLWIREYGAAGLDPKTVLRLCTRVLSGESYVEDEAFTNLVFYAFSRGKYNEEILTYLVEHLEGSTKQLRDVWKAANAFEVDTYVLEERILLQILWTSGYVGEGIKIFESYVTKTPRTEVAVAYLSYLCFEYVVRDKVMEPFLWQFILRLYVQKESLPVVVQLAWLKQIAEQKKREELDELERQAICEFAPAMVHKGMVFPFFRKFSGLHLTLDQFLDKSFIMYQAKPDSRVTLHYVLEREQAEKPEYYTEEIPHMYGGIFVRQFILFFGETLQYYITEETDGRSTLTASGTLAGNERGREQENTRYGVLDDVAMAWALQDYDTVDGLLQEFYETDYLVRKLFSLR